MVHLEDISAAFSLTSGIISLILLVFALNAYRRTRNRALAFVMGAFAVFAVKSFGVAYFVATGFDHTAVELFDAVGDLLTVALFVLPIFWPPRKGE